MNNKNLIESTIILTVASLFTRVIGFFYKIYLSNALGTYQIGLYQLIMPVYMLAWSIICSGFTTTVSKMTSEYSVRSNYKTLYKVLIIATTISFIISLFVGGFLYLFSDYVSASLLKEPTLSTSLKIVAISFPFMAIGSTVRGFFLGLKSPSIPSISQIIEQVIRIGFVVIFMAMYGEVSIPIAILGITISEIGSMIFVYVLLVKHTNNIKKTYNKRQNYMKSSELLQLILISSIPLTLNRITTSSIHTYENILVVDRLVDFGLTREMAVAELGKLTGFVSPLIFFPTTIILSISISLLPNISELKAKNDYKKINYYLSYIMNFVAVSGLFFSMFFYFLGESLSDMLFNVDVGEIIMLFGLISPLLYMQIIFNGVLNGLGKQLYIFKNNIGTSIINLSLMYVLIPRLGLNGFILAICVGSLYLCISNYRVIRKEIKTSFSIIRVFTMPFIAMILTSSFYSIVNDYIFLLNNSITFLCNILILASIYIVSLIYLRVVTVDEINNLLKEIGILKKAK